MKKKKLTTWEAACIITGYGIGGGVMALPYLAVKNGVLLSLAILLAAFAASYVLHVMIAETVIKTGGQVQIIEIFGHYLFPGKAKKALTTVFFVIMALVLFTNLATYISGAGEILAQLLGIPLLWGEILFYIVAASVVFFGLKAVGVSEKVAVTIIFGVIGVLAVCSLFKLNHSLPFRVGTLNQALAYFGLVMFAFGAFFSVPQAVEGLDGDVKKVKRAVALGLGNNLLLILVITFCALSASDTVTELAMIGWSRGIGTWAEILGDIFTVLAMLTTYWSLSLALGDIVNDQLKCDHRLCWLIGTLPSLLITLIGLGGFMEYMRLAGGLIAIIIALLVVPAYRKSRKEPGEAILGAWGGTVMQLVILIAYLLMAAGNVVPYE
ncbi:MAG: aromatic amino acid transport family protein [Eubacteriales bacterium]|nr:aromatic amino acid transport family protein [Eubacteriales bacterium]